MCAPTTSTRFLGVVSAGFPTPAEENLLDSLTIDTYLIKNREASFMLRVSGDAMSGAGIRAGDLLIVERAIEARPGKIVIAEIDGAWLVRYLRSDKTTLFLEAANPDYPPLYPKTALVITAIVRGLVRKYE